MAHFAEIDENNIVIRVTPAPDDWLTSDDKLPGTWIKTSYNTIANVHVDANTRQPDGGIPFRKNYAVPGMIYDASRDAFYYPNPPYPSWTFDETTCNWVSPSPRPEIGYYVWDEAAEIWLEITE